MLNWNWICDYQLRDDSTFLSHSAKSSNSYRNEDPLKTKLKLYLGQETSSMMSDDGGKLQKDMVHNLKLFREYTTGTNVEKFLVFNLHFCDLNPTVKMYDIIMREFVANQFPSEASQACFFALSHHLHTNQIF